MAWKGATHESIVRLGLSWQWKAAPPSLKSLYQKPSPILDKYITELLHKKVVEKVFKIKWQSRLFSVPKKESTERRVILDLSEINQYIKCPTFKMLTLKEVKVLLPKNYWTTSIDLKDGYWHIPIAKSKRPYLGFQYRGQAYQFRALPFGLNIAPRIFTKLINHVCLLASYQQIWALAYIDDILVLAPSQHQVEADTEKLIIILNQLGWIINKKKSRLIPQQSFNWLGIDWNLINHQATLPERTICLLQNHIEMITSNHLISKRMIMRLQGLLNWAGQTCHSLKPAMIYTRKIIHFLRFMMIDQQSSIPYTSNVN